TLRDGFGFSRQLASLIGFTSTRPSATACAKMPDKSARTCCKDAVVIFGASPPRNRDAWCGRYSDSFICPTCFLMRPFHNFAYPLYVAGCVSLFAQRRYSSSTNVAITASLPYVV